MGFQHVELMVEGHNHWPPMKPPRGQHYERWFHKDGRGEELQRCTRRSCRRARRAMQTFHSALPVAFHNSTWIGDRTIEFLNENKNRSSASGPRFPIRTIRSMRPSRGAGCTTRTRSTCRPSSTLDLERRPWWHRQSLEGKPQIVEHLRKIREQYSRIPVHTDQQLRELIANYYGMISLIDHNVGRILLQLESLGFWKNTLVVYSTDHGDWLGDHGLILKGPDGVRRPAARRPAVPGTGRAEGQSRRRSGVHARPAGDVLPISRGVCFSPEPQPQPGKLIEGKDSRDFAL